MKWAHISLKKFYEEARNKKSGVVPLKAEKVSAYGLTSPTWIHMAKKYRRLTTRELPPGYREGFTAQCPVVDMPVYLAYLKKKFIQKGGTLRKRTFIDLKEALIESSLVVNCSGLGAQKLVNDKKMFPIRGQIIRVTKPKGFRKMIFSDDDHNGVVLYVIPRTKDIVLGGTIEARSKNMKINKITAGKILKGCLSLGPELQHAHIINHKVGLRPFREPVRLEVEKFPGNKIVIHNYGHGGSGVTLSWGCADDVATFVKRYHERRSIGQAR